MKGITFNANLVRIATTIDGGWRVTFDAPASDSDQMMMLSRYREELLQVGIYSQSMARDYYNKKEEEQDEEHA